MQICALPAANLNLLFFHIYHACNFNKSGLIQIRNDS